MFTRKARLLLGILLVLALPLSSGVFSEGYVAYAQGEEPTIGETVNLDWVSGENWPVGEVVTLTIEDPDTALSPDYTDFEVVEDDAQANFDYFNGNQIDFDIKPGHLVTLTSGDVSRTHEVLDIEVTKVDFDANSVEGYGLPKSELFVDINACGENIPVMTNGGGFWIAYIDPACDLETVNYLFADQYDTPNTRTSYFWSMPKGSISGTVTEQDTGMPIEGMEVAACPYYYEDGMPCYSGWTEADGSYIIQSVPLGTYRLDSGWSGNWVVEYYKNTPFWEEAKPVKIKPVQGKNDKDKHFNVTGIDFTLELGGSISGTVTEQGTTNGLEGLEVSACEFEYDSPCWSGWTDADGNYLLSGIPAGTYRLATGWEDPWVVESYNEQPAYFEGDPVVVYAGDYLEGYNFTLEMGGSISGTVTEQGTTNGLEGLEVSACEFENDSPCWSAWTDADGNYLLSGIPEGIYRLSTGWEDPWAVESYNEQPTYFDGDPVVVNAGDNLEGYNFTLEMGGSISGIVSDANGPISNMAVDIVDGWFGTCTDENGQYTITGLPLGTYDIVAGRDFCGSHSYAEQIINNVTVDTSTPDVYGYDFTLEMGGSISGTVTASGGGLIEDNIDVSACFEDGSFCGWTSVQDDGTYVITGLLSGDYRVHAYQYPEEGYWIDEVYEETRDWDAYTPVAVTAGEDTSDINFTLEMGGSISGTVYQEGGGTVAGVQVDACSLNWEYCSGVETNDDGGYVIHGLLEEYTYRVFIWGKSDWASEIYEETVFFHEATPVSVGATGIDFTLAPGGSISGVVYDTSGNPLANIEVSTVDHTYIVCTDENGQYTNAGLPYGTYDIVAGGDFCGSHTYGIQSITGITIGSALPDVSGYDFTLDVSMTP